MKRVVILPFLLTAIFICSFTLTSCSQNSVVGQARTFFKQTIEEQSRSKITFVSFEKTNGITRTSFEGYEYYELYGTLTCKVTDKFVMYSIFPNIKATRTGFSLYTTPFKEDASISQGSSKYYTYPVGTVFTIAIKKEYIKTDNGWQRKNESWEALEGSASNQPIILYTGAQANEIILSPEQRAAKIRKKQAAFNQFKKGLVGKWEHKDITMLHVNYVFFENGDFYLESANGGSVWQFEIGTWELTGSYNTPIEIKLSYNDSTAHTLQIAKEVQQHSFYSTHPRGGKQLYVRVGETDEAARKQFNWLRDARAYLLETNGGAVPKLTPAIGKLKYNIVGQWQKKLTDDTQGFLELRPDGTAQYINVERKVKITGTWEVVNGKVTEGKYRGTTGYFLSLNQRNGTQVRWHIFAYDAISEMYVRMKHKAYDEEYGYYRCLNCTVPETDFSETLLSAPSTRAVPSSPTTSKNTSKNASNPTDLATTILGTWQNADGTISWEFGEKKKCKRTKKNKTKDGFYYIGENNYISYQLGLLMGTYTFVPFGIVSISGDEMSVFRLGKTVLFTRVKNGLD